MKKVTMVIVLVLFWAGSVPAQNKAALEIEHSDAIKAGGPIVLASS